MDTAAEPVPEPITVGGTALALAGLIWLKHKKKIAV
ncbi:PEP-CTERM sorting domain-containing protein [Microcoleus sp. A006_D1]